MAPRPPVGGTFYIRLMASNIHFGQDFTANVNLTGHPCIQQSGWLSQVFAKMFGNQRYILSMFIFIYMSLSKVCQCKISDLSIGKQCFDLFKNGFVSWDCSCEISGKINQCSVCLIMNNPESIEVRHIINTLTYANKLFKNRKINSHRHRDVERLASAI